MHIAQKESTAAEENYYAAINVIYTPDAPRRSRVASLIGTDQFVVSRYGNFTKEIVRSAQPFSIPDV